MLLNAGAGPKHEVGNIKTTTSQTSFSSTVPDFWSLSGIIRMAVEFPHVSSGQPEKFHVSVDTGQPRYRMTAEVVQ